MGEEGRSGWRLGGHSVRKTHDRAAEEDPSGEAKSKSRTSMTKPRRIASHAARKSVSLSPATQGFVGVAPAPCCDSLTKDPTIL